MNTYELAKTLTSALEAGDFDKATSVMTEDFQFSGTHTPPMGIQEWLGMSMGLKQAVPDISYNFTIHEAEGDTIRVSSYFTGTHTGDLDLTPMGLGVIPATGIAFQTGEQSSTATIRDGKVASVHIEEVPGGGFPEMLRQIGVEMPG